MTEDQPICPRCGRSESGVKRTDHGDFLVCMFCGYTTEDDHAFCTDCCYRDECGGKANPDCRYAMNIVRDFARRWCAHCQSEMCTRTSSEILYCQLAKIACQDADEDLMGYAI